MSDLTMRFLRFGLLWTFGLIVLIAPGCSRTESMSSAPAGWTLDERQSYEMSLQSSYGPAQGAPLFAFELSAALQLTAIRREANSVEFLLRLRQPKLTARQSGEALEGLEKIRSDLEKPYLFVLKNGRFTQSRVSQDANPLVLGVMRSLSSAFQYASGTAATSRKWEAHETDGTGDYLASYERLPSATLRKQKLRYESWSAAAKVSVDLGAKVGLPRVLRSITEIQGPAAAPARIALDELLEIELGRTTSLRSSTSLKLIRRGSQRAPMTPSERRDLYASTVELAAGAPLATTGPAPDLDRAKLAGLSFPQILAGLEAQAQGRSASKPPDPNTASATPQAADERSRIEETRLFSALNASLRQTPDNVSQIEHAIRSNAAARDMLISGLGAAGTEEGQRTLLKLMADTSLPEQVRNACALSLARTPRPSTAAVRGLEALLDNPDFHRLAVYGLGTFARLLRQAGDVAESKRLAGILIGRLRDAKMNHDKVDLILGLSNSATPEIVDMVKAGPISDPSADVRNAAVTALRLIDEPQAEQMVVAVLTSDQDRRVRLAALRALHGDRASTRVIQALEHASLKDDSDRVRYESVQLIGRLLPQTPALRSTLEQVAKVDSQPLIRELAESALTGSATSSSLDANHES